MSTSLPSVIGRRGIEQVLEVPMNDTERNSFQASAPLLQARYAQIK